MGKNNRLRKAAERASSDAVPQRHLTQLEKVILGLEKDDKQSNAFVNLKYYAPDFQCFSAWSPDELKAFSQFCQKLRQLTWQDIYRTGGAAGKKTGLGYTPHKDPQKLPKHIELVQLSEDLTWFELRVTEKVRVHGFRATDAFFLVYLDREHSIYPM